MTRMMDFEAFMAEVKKFDKFKRLEVERPSKGENMVGYSGHVIGDDAMNSVKSTVFS